MQTTSEMHVLAHLMLQLLSQVHIQDAHIIRIHLMHKVHQNHKSATTHVSGIIMKMHIWPHELSFVHDICALTSQELIAIHFKSQILPTSESVAWKMSKSHKLVIQLTNQMHGHHIQAPYDTFMAKYHKNGKVPLIRVSVDRMWSGMNFDTLTSWCGD